MSLEEHEVDAMLFVLEKHLGEPCLTMSDFKDMLDDWVEMVEDKYASEEDVPAWVLHLNKVKDNIKNNMLLEDQCVVFVGNE